MPRRVSANGRQQALLVTIVRASERGSGVFITASSFDGTTMLHDGLGKGGVKIDIGDIHALATEGLLSIT